MGIQCNFLSIGLGKFERTTTSLLYRVCKSVTKEAYQLVNNAKVSNVPILVQKHYVTRKHSSRMRTTRLATIHALVAVIRCQ